MKFWLTGILFIMASSIACSLNRTVTPSVSGGSGTARTDSRNIVGYKKIKADSAIELNVAVTNGYSIIVKADDNVIAAVTTELQGDTLVISIIDRSPIRSKVNVAITLPELRGLDLSGATSATVTGIKSQDLEIDADGASRAKVEGSTRSLTIKAVGASNVEAENLKSEKAEVEAVGASSINVLATDDLKADATGASNINYIGQPKTLKKNAVDVSNINEK